MSEWYETDDDDISIDLEKSEINIIVLQNYYGSIYATLSFRQVEEAYQKINKLKEKGSQE